MHNKFSLLFIKISVPSTSHSLPGTSYGVALSCSYAFWYSIQVECCLTASSMSAFIFTQYTNPLSSQFPCGCCVAVFISASAIEILLLLTCLLWPHHLSWPTYAWGANIILCLVPHSLLFDQAFIIYSFSSCRCASLDVTSCILHTDVHIGRSTAVFITLKFMVSLCTSLSLFSSWLCHDSQFSMNSLGPGLWSMHTLYWCMQRFNCYRCCNNIATSLPIIVINVLWSMMQSTLLAKH